MERNKCYRWCFVLTCKSTSVKNQEKIFLCVPKGELRKKWYKTVRHDMCPTTLFSLRKYSGINSGSILPASVNSFSVRGYVSGLTLLN